MKQIPWKLLAFLIKCNVNVQKSGKMRGAKLEMSVSSFSKDRGWAKHLVSQESNFILILQNIVLSFNFL